MSDAIAVSLPLQRVRLSRRQRSSRCPRLAALPFARVGRGRGGLLGLPRHRPARQLWHSAAVTVAARQARKVKRVNAARYAPRQAQGPAAECGASCLIIGQW